MTIICNTKPDHLYKRYYCKICKDFHSKGDENYISHREHKLNRYFCPKCNKTHISSRGEKFLKHLEEKGKEISYFNICCSLKCDYKKFKNITLNDEDAQLLINLQHEASSLRESYTNQTKRDSQKYFKKKIEDFEKNQEMIEKITEMIYLEDEQKEIERLKRLRNGFLEKRKEILL